MTTGKTINKTHGNVSDATAVLRQFPFAIGLGWSGASLAGWLGGSWAQILGSLAVGMVAGYLIDQWS